MKKFLICTGEDNFFDKKGTMFKSNNKNLNIVFEKMYTSNSFFSKLKRNLGYPFIKSEVREIWKSDLKDYDVIILFEIIVKNSIIKLIREKNPNIRIIIYFRNQFSNVKEKNLSLKYLKKYNCEFWTYNIDDCKRYGFKYNCQFWNLNYLDLLDKNTKSEHGCLFLGRVKNRIDDIKTLHDILKTNKIDDYFYLVPKTEYVFDKNYDNIYLDYLEYLKLLNKSKCVIDLVGEDNYGLTLRPLEAMFLGKKLITNYKKIKSYDFYNPKNIFILGYDREEELKSFVESPFEKIDTKISSEYNFDNWLNKFMKYDESEKVK